MSKSGEEKLSKIASIIGWFLIGILFKLWYKVTCIKETTFFGYFGDWFICCTQKQFWLIYSIIRQIIIWSCTHNPTEKADKMIFWNMDILYHIINGYWIGVIILNKINYHINIIRMLTFLTFLFIFDCVNNKCIQNIMYLRRSGNTAENIIFCHVTYKLRQLLFKTQKVFYGNNIYRVRVENIKHCRQCTAF